MLGDFSDDIFIGDYFFCSVIAIKVCPQYENLLYEKKKNFNGEAD
jgi:hypothetical protein